MKKKSLHEPVQNKSLSDVIAGFLEVFRDMEANGETERIVFGSLAGPLDSSMVYRYKVTIGLENASAQLKKSQEKKRIVR
jgi:hypothetical protein